MIAAIADDLTGAIEIAGLGWRCGLTSEVLTRAKPPGRSELIVYDSDSRHCSSGQARRRVTRIVRQLQSHRPEWIFKKTDSVLRGQVLAEVEALLQELSLPRCILAPANPTGGRVIRHGRYFIHGTPVDRTDFRRDPLYPRLSSRVLDMLGKSSSFSVRICGPRSAKPEHGIIVGEATLFQELLYWARAVDAETLPAGGGDFFHALLQARGFKQRVRARASRFPMYSTQPHGQRTIRPRRTLFVSGSPADSALRFLRACRAKGWPVLLMPGELLGPSRTRVGPRMAWVRSIIAAGQEHPKVAVGIGRPLLPGGQMARRLETRLVTSVIRALRESTPDCLCVEGGATAALLTRKLGWTRLKVEHEFARGVTAVRPRAQPRLTLICKPGSYTWPADFLC